MQLDRLPCCRSKTVAVETTIGMSLKIEPECVRRDSVM